MVKSPTSQVELNQDLILKADTPILDIASRFWECERQNAAGICYRSMRAIDDLVDNRKTEMLTLSPLEKHQFTTLVNAWAEGVDTTFPRDLQQQELLNVITRFQIPKWPWQQFAQSMIYDIHHNGFRTFTTFLTYAEGAAVAPGSIALHLCGVTKVTGQYLPPQFNIRKVARPLALFSYLVHIIRDFQKDQHDNLNYLTQDLMNRYNITPETLKAIAEGQAIPIKFRELMNVYYRLADYYRSKARKALNTIQVFLQPRYQLSFEIIYNLYHLVFERINISKGTFTSKEFTPSSQDIKDRITQIISNFYSTIEKRETRSRRGLSRS
jgi:phytoene/squalene synthetase